jgi:phosphoglucomutase
MPSNHFLAVSIDHLFRTRTQWRADARIGKTVVSSSMIDRVAASLGRGVYEVPVGFKWFAAGLYDGTLGFGGEESAGSAFLRRDGQAWTTDKDGIAAALLAAEICAATGRDPGERYRALEESLGTSAFTRIDAPADAARKKQLAALTPEQLPLRELAGDPITQVLTRAPGNDAPIGGIKVATARGWFAARPSGTEDIFKLYAESFVGSAHLECIVADARGAL